MVVARIGLSSGTDDHHLVNPGHEGRADTPAPWRPGPQRGGPSSPRRPGGRTVASVCRRRGRGNHDEREVVVVRQQDHARDASRTDPVNAISGWWLSGETCEEASDWYFGVMFPVGLQLRLKATCLRRPQAWPRAAGTYATALRVLV